MFVYSSFSVSNCVHLFLSPDLSIFPSSYFCYSIFVSFIFMSQYLFLSSFAYQSPCVLDYQLSVAVFISFFFSFLSFYCILLVRYLCFYFCMLNCIFVSLSFFLFVSLSFCLDISPIVLSPYICISACLYFSLSVFLPFFLYFSLFF